ncbi:MAG: hypothetical protein ACOZBH_01725 [Patescibacteria group bacterium]
MTGFYLKLTRAPDKSSEVHVKLVGLDEVEGIILKDPELKEILFIFKSNDREIDIARGFAGRGWRALEKRQLDVSEEFMRAARFFLKDRKALEDLWEIENNKSVSS